MDINLIRSLGTLFVFIAFIALCLWAYSPNRKKEFHEAEMLPFGDEINQPNAENITQDQLGAKKND